MTSKNIIIGLTSLSMALSTFPSLGMATTTDLSISSTQSITQTQTQATTTETSTDNAFIDSVQIFTDIPYANPLFNVTTDLNSRGIVNGYPDKTFRPEVLVTRAEALKMVLTAAKISIPDVTVPTNFTDTKTVEWFTKYISKAVSLKIVQGYPDNTFRPNNEVLTVESLAMLVKTWGIDLSAITVTENPFADVGTNLWYSKLVTYAKSSQWIKGDTSNMIYPVKEMTRGEIALLIYNAIHSPALQPVQTEPEQPAQPTQDQPSTVSNGTAISILNFNYVESILNIKVGQTITWTNKDPILHTVTSDLGDTTMNSGDLGFNQTYSVTFTKAGTYKYHDERLVFMKGTVNVTE